MHQWCRRSGCRRSRHLKSRRGCCSAGSAGFSSYGMLHAPCARCTQSVMNTKAPPALCYLTYCDPTKQIQSLITVFQMCRFNFPALFLQNLFQHLSNIVLLLGNTTPHSSQLLLSIQKCLLFPLALFQFMGFVSAPGLPFSPSAELSSLVQPLGAFQSMMQCAICE